MTGVPLYMTSAEPFEALYAIVRRCFTSGTRNVPMQIMENAFTRLKYKSIFMQFVYVCNVDFLNRYSAIYAEDRKMKIRKATRSTRIADNIVVLRDGSMATVLTKEAPYRAHKVILDPFDPDIEVKLPWAAVGVHRYGGLQYDRTIILQRADIVGKGMRCGELVCAWHQNWFMSKYDDN